MRRALAYLVQRPANQIAAMPPAPMPTLANMMLGEVFAHAKMRDEAEPKSGGPSVQAIEVIGACAEILGSMACQGSGEDADCIIATAHAALDTAYRTQLTGVPSAINYGSAVQAVH